jgi:hypothetical protein
MLRLSGFLAGLLLLAGVAIEAGAARINGFVLDAASGEALIGANIRVLDASAGAATNIDGYFVIVGLQPGRFELEASHQGYRSVREAVVVVSDLDAFVELRLESAPFYLQEVVVTAEKSLQELQRTEVFAGSVRLERQQLEMAPPLIEKDILRAFQTVPGVLPSNDFSSDLNVRGSRADENLILLDGVEVYNPNHLGGLFSAFIPSAVKHADLLRSSYPAQHGGRLGAVMIVSSREGNRQNIDTEISLGVLSSSLVLSGPLKRGGRSSWLLAGRRTYIDLATRLFTESEVPYHFADFQGRFNWDLGPRDKISVTGYWGDDVLDTESLDFGFGNRAANVNWRHIWNTRWYSRTIAAFTRFRSELDFGGKETVLDQSHVNDWSVRLLLEYHHDQGLYLETGVVLKEIWTSYNNWVFNTHKWDVDFPMSQVEAYAAATWRPHPLLIVEPGLRLVDYRAARLLDEGDDHLRFEPRLGVKALLSDRMRVKLAWGVYHQALQQFRRDGSTFSFLWVAIDSTSNPARAIHWTAGVELDLSPGTTAELEGYYKSMDEVSEARALIADHSAEDPTWNTMLFHYGSGEAFGLDLDLQRTQGFWTGRVGYSLGWAVRDFDELNDGQPFYASYDKRHNANLVLNRAFVHGREKGFPFSRWLRFFRYNESALGLTVRYGSGPRYTRPYSATWLGGEGLNTEESVIHNFGSLNSNELAAYSRVDLAWSWIRRLEGSYFECRLGLLNLFNNPNYWGVEFDYTERLETGEPVTVKTEGVRRLPSLELNWRF